MKPIRPAIAPVMTIMLLGIVAAPVKQLKINLPFNLPSFNISDRPLIRVNGEQPADRSADQRESADQRVDEPKPIAEVNLPFYRMQLPFSRTVQETDENRGDNGPKIAATEEEMIHGNLGRNMDIGPESTLPVKNKLELPMSVMHMPFNQVRLPMSKVLLPLSHIGSSYGLGSIFPGGVPLERSAAASNAENKTEKNGIDIVGLIKNVTTELGGKSWPKQLFPEKSVKSETDVPTDRMFDTVQQNMAEDEQRRLSEFSMPYSFLNLPFSYMNFPFSYMNLPFQGLHLPFLNLNTPTSMVTGPFAELMYNFPSFRGAEPRLVDRMPKLPRSISERRSNISELRRIADKILKKPEPQSESNRILTIKKLLDEALARRGDVNLTIDHVNSKVLKPLFRSIGVPEIDFGMFGTPLTIVEAPLSLLLMPFNFLDSPLSYLNLPFSHFALPFSFFAPPFSAPLEDFKDIRIPTKGQPKTDVNDLPPSLLEALNPNDPLRSYLNLPMSEMNLPFAVFDLPFEVLATPLAHLNLPMYQVQNPFTHVHLPFEHSAFPFRHWLGATKRRKRTLSKRKGIEDRKRNTIRNER